MKSHERNGKMLNDIVNERSDLSIDVIALHDTYVKTKARRFVAPSLVSACRQSGGQFRVYDREDIVSSRFDVELSTILTSSSFSNCMVRLRASPDVLSVGRCFGLVREPTKNREGIWRATRCNRDTSFAFELELVDRKNMWMNHLWGDSSVPPSFVTLQCAFMYEYVDDENVSRRVRFISFSEFLLSSLRSHSSEKHRQTTTDTSCMYKTFSTRRDSCASIDMSRIDCGLCVATHSL